ncbi:alpha/beta hydrolase [uncultured Pseudokineococcus sp.]|uniref:alpha/beta hydrolase n=1 Tax=uncultured Pseudokineococcus sp. TaxID=1642928 RepID=UPI0026051CBD|nr:alpha/beta hydrolase [uncultured Pseudokineococcus sp.]
MTGTSTRSRRVLGRGAVAAAGVLVLAGCSGAAEPVGGPATTLPAPGPVTATAGEAAQDPALARFYDQQPEWVPCGQVRECTTVTVPVSWAEPAGEVLELAVARVPAGDEDERLGSLLVNPGGPGASGVEWVGADAAAVVSEEVRERYDVVGFDPRGVGSSEPVDCVDDAALDAYLAEDVDTTTLEGRAEAVERAREFAAGCEADAGALLGEVGTPSVARDLDVLRAVLGDERLSYLGKSYGTLIGAEYARLNPQRVGRLVLDGALDPASTAEEVAVGQARGLESSLRAFVTACLAGDVDDCPLEPGDGGEGAVDAALAEVAALVEGAAETPLPTGDPDRPLTRPLAATGVVAPLYEDALWPVLATALAQAQDGDGAGLLALADAYSGRAEDGSYASNLLEAFTAVSCLDYPAAPDDPAEQARVREQLEEAAPTFAGLLVGEDVTCDVWPEQPVRTPAPVEAAGAAPVLVVGTTGDPATPYAWAQSLADQLASGRLLTYEGEGHTAYLRASECVDGAVDAYLLQGVLPGEGAACET